MISVHEICGDNRFEIIENAKKRLCIATNIEDSPNELAVIDSFLFRMWQMGWLPGCERAERIMRCKDCKYFKKRSPVVTTDDYRCSNPKWMNGGVWSVQVSPDGFCAWGESKVI